MIFMARSVLEKTAPITEIFSSCQMEGYNLGKPSVFVRFHGCTLHCQFNDAGCDSIYAVTGNDFKQYTVSQAKDEIIKYEINHIIFTGGEPLIYEQFMIELIQKLQDSKNGYTFEVETNGTLPVGVLFSLLVTRFNISVKLKSSNQKKGYDNKRINYKSLNTYPIQKSSFKFVINDAVNDIKEIKKILIKYPKMRVYLMAQGKTRDEVIKNSRKVVELCIKHNYYYSPREHIILWGKQRGR